MKLSFSLLAFLLSLSALAQEEKTDTVRRDTVRVKRIKEKYELKAVRFGTDIIALIKSGGVKGFSGWELNGDLDIGRYYFAVDYGHSARDYDDVNKGGTYQNNGYYWRAGADVNLLKKDPERNMFYFGLRYGHSSFNESATIPVTDPYYGNFTKAVSNASVTGTWIELVSGIKVKVYREFWLGMTARLKFLPAVSGDQQLTTYEIPGYGLYSEGIYWGFNYQVFYRIPFNTKNASAPK